VYEIIPHIFLFLFPGKKSLGRGSAVSRPERSGARQGRLDSAEPRPYSLLLKEKQRSTAARTHSASSNQASCAAGGSYIPSSKGISFSPGAHPGTRSAKPTYKFQLFNVLWRAPRSVRHLAVVDFVAVRSSLFNRISIARGETRPLSPHPSTPPSPVQTIAVGLPRQDF
jgi:hypothetical protein